MKNNNYTFKAIILSAVYWLVESTIHRFIFEENEYVIFPLDTDELWMRIVIVLLLICFGIYADWNTKLTLRKEREKRIIFNATISSTQHILNNLLNQMQYFKMKADESDVFDKVDSDIYEQAIKEGMGLIKSLSAVDELSEEAIRLSVYPKFKNEYRT